MFNTAGSGESKEEEGIVQEVQVSKGAESNPHECPRRSPCSDGYHLGGGRGRRGKTPAAGWWGTGYQCRGGGGRRDAPVPPSPAASERGQRSHPVPRALPGEGRLPVPLISGSCRSPGESAGAIAAQNRYGISLPRKAPRGPGAGRPPDSATHLRQRVPLAAAGAWGWDK